MIGECPLPLETKAPEDVTETRGIIRAALAADGVVILPPMDVEASLKLLAKLALHPVATIIDPWYNKGVGGIREDYKSYILNLLSLAGGISTHVFFWGFPEIVAHFIDDISPPMGLVAWLTWYYKNNPSVIRGWRSSQNACLHLAQPGATLYPEHFLNEAQKNLQAQGKLRYMPGPTSVIEEVMLSPADVIEQALLVGFVGKKEQTGHPAQKPIGVFEKLFLMTAKAGDLVFDPMSGSGTTGEAARKLGLTSIIADESEEYTRFAEKRLQVERLRLPECVRTAI